MKSRSGKSGASGEVGRIGRGRGRGEVGEIGRGREEPKASVGVGGSRGAIADIGRGRGNRSGSGGSVGIGGSRERSVKNRVRIRRARYLLGRVEEAVRGDDDGAALLGAAHELLPPPAHALRALPDGVRIEVAALDEFLRSRMHLRRAMARFLESRETR